MNYEGGAIAMPTEKPRYSIVVDHDLLKRIDDFRFQNRYPSRSAATIYLIRLGLDELDRREAQKEKDETRP